MPTTFTSDQILGLAPDHYTAKSSRGLAVPDKWTLLGVHDQMLWGEIPLINRVPQQIRIDLNGPVFDCSCKTRKIPCRHALALALLWVEQPAAFTSGEMPSWVTGWHPLTTRPRPDPTHPRSDGLTPDERRRLQLVQTGMAELSLWLKDLIDDGLAGIGQRPQNSWLGRVNRLVDAQAGQIAADVRHLSTLIGKGVDWPERFLRAAGRLYLLTRAFARYDQLSPQAQGDLRAAVGWFPRRFGYPGETVIEDVWQIVGRQTEQIEKQYLYRTWLWGLNRNQPALVARATHDRRAGVALLTTGLAAQGELVFAPSGAPLLVAPPAESQAGPPLPESAGFATIAAAREAHAAAVGANPWLRSYPFLLRQVGLETAGGRWVLADRAGDLLPVVESHPQLYHLLILSGGLPFTLFGEWAEQTFNPVSIYYDGRWRDLHAMGGSS